MLLNLDDVPVSKRAFRTPNSPTEPTTKTIGCGTPYACAKVSSLSTTLESLYDLVEKLDIPEE